MKPIAHHPNDPVDLADLIGGDRRHLAHSDEIMIGQAEPRPLASSIMNSLWIAGGLAVIEPSSAELCAALRSVAARSAGLFRLMVEMPGEYPIPLGDGRRAILPNIGVTGDTSVDRWLTGFYAACVVRDEAALLRFATTPVADLRRSTTRADNCMFLWVEVLQSWQTSAPETAAKLRAALEATDPARLQISDSNYILNILVPVMQLLFRVIEGDAAAFDDALQFAVERHKKYWGSAKHHNDPEGFIALGPLAMMSLARDAGIAVDPASDYLPHCS
ncbi:MAG TPA: immunity 49 family protein [Kofleriaceae bacterium]|jgi:hypothetical protein|nr:immunity 49 family protein [Kofleriaceae bacterium]